MHIPEVSSARARPGRRVGPRSRAVALAVAALAWLAACVADPVTGKRNVSFVNWTPEQELEVGQKFAPNIESEFDAVYPDAEANAYLGELVGRMVELSPRSEDFDFHFKILNSSTPNALALPGGYVYITRGLLTELESESQFISVMGHELGHVEHRHSMLNQTKGLLGWSGRALGSLGQALPVGGRIVGGLGQLVAAPSNLLGLRFSRTQELEADARGVFFAAGMGYDPLDAVQTFELFQRLEDEAGARASQVSIFRTHPVNSKRIEKIEARVARDYPESVGASAPKSDRFEELVSGLREHAVAYELYDQAVERLIEEAPDLGAARADLVEARRLQPEEPLFWILAGEVEALAEDLPRAAPHFRRALELYARRSPGDGHWKASLYLGLFALLDQRPELAADYLEQASERYPMNPTAHLLLGHAHAGSGHSKAARKEYEAVLELTPKKDPLHQEAREALRALEKP